MRAIPPVVERAKADIAKGQWWRARLRLEGYIGSVGYHPEVVELLGDTCWRMGDAPAAGRFWFFTPADRDCKRDAIEVFVRLHRGHPFQLLSQLPKKLVAWEWLDYPLEVRQRLDRLAPRLRTHPSSAPAASSVPRPRSKAADFLAVSVFLAILAFCFVCFCIGLATVLRVI